MTGRRELTLWFINQVTEHAVEISRIFHGAQDWP
jgi:plasmid stabilization system protein ParE